MLNNRHAFQPRQPATRDVRLQGLVRTWGARGFGWIDPDDPDDAPARGGIFVHFSDVIPPGYLRPDTRVTFELENDRGRMKAVRVKVTE
jgi:cold shock CspA family protein